MSILQPLAFFFLQTYFNHENIDIMFGGGLRLLPRLLKRSSKSRGLAPGSLVHIGEKKLEKVRISILDYNVDTFEEKTVDTIEETFMFKTKPTTTWINIDGLHNIEVIEKIGTHFEIHPLIQ